MKDGKGLHTEDEEKKNQYILEVFIRVISCETDVGDNHARETYDKQIQETIQK